MAVKTFSIRVPEALAEKVQQVAGNIWGTHESRAEATKNALRDWVARTEGPSTEQRLQQLENRLVTLERRPYTAAATSTEQPRNVPTADHLGVSEELGLRSSWHVDLEELQDRKWEPAPAPDRKEWERIKGSYRDVPCVGSIAPEGLVGFRHGPVDLQPYIEAGIPPARPERCYSLDDEGFRATISHFMTADQLFAKPLVVWLHKKNIYVVDGLARLSAIGLARHASAGACPKVPFVFVSHGNHRPDIVRLMITLNLNNGPRALTQEEYERALERHRRIKQASP